MPTKKESCKKCGQLYTDYGNADRRIAGLCTTCASDKMRIDKMEEGTMMPQPPDPNRFSDLQNTLSPEEIRIIKELRAIPWGKLTVIKKGGAIVMITPAPDILCKK